MSPGATALCAVASDDPTTLTVKHESRILDTELHAASSRIAWAVLLRRTYGVAYRLTPGPAWQRPHPG